MNKIIIANWKMNGSRNLAQEFNTGFNPIYYNLVICPPHNLLGYFQEEIILGAQDCSIVSNGSGAFTGEISAEFLANSGVKYIIIGHSERRVIIGESEEVLTTKLLQVSKSKAIPIFCIGEDLNQFQNKQTLEILESQLKILRNLNFPNGLIIAYEPVWSIGTGIIPTYEIIAPLVKNIKEMIHDINNSIEKNCKLIYGGSVSEQNIEQMCSWPVDGFLVGGASLDVAKLKIIYQKTNV